MNIKYCSFFTIFTNNDWSS